MRPRKTGRRKKRVLTTKQQIYFRLLCKGVPATQAALKAGYSVRCAPQAAYQATRSIRERIQGALFEAGLTPEGLVHKHLLPALGAMETKFAQSEGSFTDERNVIAWGPRLKAIELTAEMGGYMAPRELEKAEGEGKFPKVIDVSNMRSRPLPAPQLVQGP